MRARNRLPNKWLVPCDTPSKAAYGRSVGYAVEIAWMGAQSRSLPLRYELIISRRTYKYSSIVGPPEAVHLPERHAKRSPVALPALHRMPFIVW